MIMTESKLARYLTAFTFEFLVFDAGSSVARGGGAKAFSIGMQGMQNTTFSVFLRPVFALKPK